MIAQDRELTTARAITFRSGEEGNTGVARGCQTARDKGVTPPQVP
jgi:hypothetical protein